MGWASLGLRSFCVSAPTTWKTLPQSVCFRESVTTFQKHLKNTLFPTGILCRPLAAYYPAPQIQIFDSGTYLLTYLLKNSGFSEPCLKYYFLFVFNWPILPYLLQVRPGPQGRTSEDCCCCGFLQAGCPSCHTNNSVKSSNQSSQVKI